jgi:hypothetical protein
MTALFAALEARANAAVMRTLSNATASGGGGDPVAGIFDSPYAVGSVGVGMAGSQPCFTTAAQFVPPEPEGLSLACGGVSYVIAAAEPDGAGMVRLILELA